MTDFSGGIPKGRAMRGPVARAIDVEKIEGVSRVVVDQYDDVVYMQCTPAAWAEIQARGARHTGVEHTGAVRKQWLEQHIAPEPELRLVCAWCTKVLREGAEPTSHGVCDSCSAKVFPSTKDDFIFIVTMRQGSDDVWMVGITLEADGSEFIAFPAESFLHAVRIERFLLLNAKKTAELLLSGHAAQVRDVQYAVQMGVITNGTTAAHERWMATRPLKVTQ